MAVNVEKNDTFFDGEEEQAGPLRYAGLLALTADCGAISSIIDDVRGVVSLKHDLMISILDREGYSVQSHSPIHQIIFIIILSGEWKNEKMYKTGQASSLQFLLFHFPHVP